MMSENRKNFKQAVKDYYSGKSLSNTQIRTLQVMQQQIQPAIEQPTRKLDIAYRKRSWLAAVAASLIIFVVVFAYVATPSVIADAYADIAGDNSEFNGLQSSLVEWLETNNIAAVPEQYEVEMSKNCRLGDYYTKHLRIAGVEQGKLHLFFHQGNRPPYWLNRSGVMSDMNWKLMKVRNDLTLIVMYTQDMREKSIKHILGEMLPDIQELNIV
ncbi:MAG: hypothetical protein OQL09_04325 [Gammaproteobacteria bacterium]|nr:hypothetical protein [Gammaproteobacteria bacterium]